MNEYYRKADYSGKKRLTRKNTLIAGPSRFTHYLGPTTSGSTHDYQLLNNEINANLGLPAASLPHRKPRRSKKYPAAALTDTQRADNGAHARRRVKVEHTISGTKRLGCVAQIYPNKSNSLNDRMLALACGLCDNSNRPARCRLRCCPRPAPPATRWPRWV